MKFKKYVAGGALILCTGMLFNVTAPFFDEAAAQNATSTSAGAEFAYVSDLSTKSLRLYKVETSGAFTPLSPAAITYDDLVDSVATTPNGAFLYVSHNDKISQYRISATGALIALSPPSVTISVTPSDSLQSLQLTVHPNGQRLYASNGAASAIEPFTIGADGALTATRTPTVLSKVPTRLATSPTGTALYALLREPSVNGSPMPFSFVGQFQVENSGALTPLSPTTVDTGMVATSIIVNAAKQAVYVVNSYDDPQTVSQFHIGANGALTPLVPALVASGFSADAPRGGKSEVVVSPDGQHVYVINNAEATLVGYQVAADGAIINPDKKKLDMIPIGIAVRPSNGAIYVSGRTIQRITLDAQGKINETTTNVLMESATSAPGIPPQQATGLFSSLLTVRPQVATATPIEETPSAN